MTQSHITAKIHKYPKLLTPRSSNIQVAHVLSGTGDRNLWPLNKIHKGKQLVAPGKQIKALIQFS